MPERALACFVYGKELPGDYVVSDVEEEAKGCYLRGGVDVTLDQSTKVPYLFRVGGDDGLLHLCCPMKSPPERPRYFDGPGYVAMRRGRASDKAEEDLQSLPEAERILRYLGELAEIMDSHPSAGPSNGRDAADRVEDINCNTMTSSAVFGQETLEEKEKRLTADQKKTALRVKYGGNVEDAALQLVSAKVGPDTYPEQAQELKRILRRFSWTQKVNQQPQPSASPEPAEVVPAEVQQPGEPTAAESVTMADSPAAAVAGTACSTNPAKIEQATLPVARGSCWQGCFAGLRAQKRP